MAESPLRGLKTQWENYKSLQTTILNLMKMAESSQISRKHCGKTLWEKEKLLVTSNFSFSHIVFKRPVIKGTYKQGLVWETVNTPSG